MSSHVTRELLESLLNIIGFVKADEKKTPKISFFLLRRTDIVPAYTDPAATTSSSSSSSKAVAPSVGYGKDWKPVIVARTPSEYATLCRFAGTAKMLPKSELPVTGFSRTDFSLCVEKSWIVKDYE
jgi:hypothetical protein